MRILIVEVEALIAMALSDTLETAGHQVLGLAATMAEALALSAAAPPQLALLDLDLRDGSSGVDTARALVVGWGVRCIFASGRTSEARQARDFAFGLIHKPFDLQTVLRSVEVARAVMEGRPPGAVPPGFELFAAAE